MNNSENQQSNYNQSSTQGYDNANVISLRLDTSTVVSQIETFLRAERESIDVKTGTITKIRQGLPLANDEGIAGILNSITMIINPQVVQGNFTIEQYQDYISGLRKSMARDLFVNRVVWGINEKKYGYIVDNIMNLVKPFMSRLIDNKERDSYSSTMRHQESNTIKNKSGGWFFGSGE